MMDFINDNYLEVITAAVTAVLGLINKLTVFYKNSEGPWWVRLLLFITELGIIPSKGAGMLKFPLIPKPPE